MHTEIGYRGYVDLLTAKDCEFIIGHTLGHVDLDVMHTEVMATVYRPWHDAEQARFLQVISKLRHYDPFED